MNVKKNTMDIVFLVEIWTRIFLLACCDILTAQIKKIEGLTHVFKLTMTLVSGATRYA